MSNTKLPAARATAPGVDPATPAPGAPVSTPPADTKKDDGPVVTKAEATKIEPAPAPLAGNGATAEIEMVKVRTKDPIILMDPFSARHIDNRDEGTEVPVTSFINDELLEGGRLEKA